MRNGDSVIDTASVLAMMSVTVYATSTVWATVFGNGVSNGMHNSNGVGDRDGNHNYNGVGAGYVGGHYMRDCNGVSGVVDGDNGEDVATAWARRQ